ncbi:MAG: hypothetical protein LBL43_08535 [Treponema sp.]|nr:hypothetical protein [Treponema sp.]
MLLLAFPLYTQESFFDRIFFSLTPRLIEDGSILDSSLGFRYTRRLAGELRFRRTESSLNEEFEGVKDSLNAINSSIYEFYLLPLEYYARSSALEFRGGLGAYFYNESLKEKGFFNMPELEQLSPPRERVNSYTNDFSLRILGPLVQGSLSWIPSEWFRFVLQAGVAPVFGAWVDQTTTIEPLLDPRRMEHSQRKLGSPYVFTEFSAVVVKYLYLAAFWDFYRFRYDWLDMDYDGTGFVWVYGEREVVSSSVKLEANILIPLGRDMCAQVGYGHIFETIRAASAPAERTNKHYFTVSGKKLLD